ncbi:polyprenol phosphomannose-dependent alpha 1,6 mannosyltransferase MptB [Micropruina sonneratiae]|uniref:polyprenol phosphomannose-dependent alpha 1,6 mannosyltransferase MptB n=1 Tax=Micropruina sonneratiae TaxID=2986940 RepID=UPI002227727C|nr:polyprenol phosphomannose-dependent alpha 1,6 mannosyltransferase MptB [Micropruina sp. KQZ13P-5]MCW3156957.1 polyprenol phosphomannose-dependent alpha 1,6 mannosyltransferase MptB [Micropruina sp. KQZ13P-5]
MPAVSLLTRRIGPVAAATLGATGTLLIGWGSCHPEFAFGPDGWPSATVNAIGLALPLPWNRVAIVAGVTLLALAWWWLRPDADRPTPHRRLFAVLAVWSLPMLLVPPVLSADAVLYADLGWIVNQGQNPYLIGLTGAGGPYAPHVDPLWAGSGVAYPPLALLQDAAVVRLAGFATYGGIVAMRLPALAAIAAIAWTLPRLARRLGSDPARALWWGLANPLVVVHFVGGAHNDAVMVALALAGVLLALRGPHWAWGLLAGPAVIGVAMAIKPQAGLAVLACAGLPVAAELARRPFGARVPLLARRSAIAAVVAVGAFVVVTLPTGLGFGWTRWLSLMGRAGTAAPFSVLAQAGELVIQQLGGETSSWLAGVGAVSTLAMVAALAWIVLHLADRPLAAVGWGSLAVSVLGQSMHPWYIPWSLALLALVPLTRRQFGWLTCFGIGFVVWNAIQTVVWHSVR